MGEKNLDKVLQNRANNCFRGPSIVFYTSQHINTH